MNTVFSSRNVASVLQCWPKGLPTGGGACECHVWNTLAITGTLDLPHLVCSGHVSQRVAINAEYDEAQVLGHMHVFDWLIPSHAHCSFSIAHWADVTRSSLGSAIVCALPSVIISVMLVFSTLSSHWRCMYLGVCALGNVYTLDLKSIPSGIAR